MSKTGYMQYYSYEQRTILNARQENKVLTTFDKADQIELGPCEKLTVKLSLCTRDYYRVT